MVVHCRDDADGLMRALGSAVETCADLDDVEAIVIDDASGPAAAAVIDGLGAMCAWCATRRRWAPRPRSPPPWSSPGRQAALLMTSDVVLLPGWLDPLADALALPGVSGAAPAVLRGTGREVCVLTSVASARAGAAVSPCPSPTRWCARAPAGSMEVVA